MSSVDWTRWNSTFTNFNVSPNTHELSNTSDLSDKDRLLLQIDKYLKIYYSIFLLCVGTVFNILSILVLSRPAFQRTTISIYLRFLAVVDMFTLYNGLSRQLVSAAFDYNIRHLGEGFCKFHQWTSAFAPDVSAWILVAVTTERLLSIVKPYRVRTMCTQFTALVTVTCISVIIIASNLPLLLNYGDTHAREVGNITIISRCVLRQQIHFMENTWYWIDITKFILLPSLILVVFNVAIVVFVIRSRRSVDRWNSSARISTVAVSEPTTEGHRSSTRVSGSKKEVSLIVTLVVVNAMFVIFNSPISIYLLGAKYWFPDGFTPEERVTLTVAILAMYTNNASNFLFYCITGTRFRAEIKQLFSSCAKVKVSQRASCCFEIADLHRKQKEEPIKVIAFKSRDTTRETMTYNEENNYCSQHM